MLIKPLLAYGRSLYPLIISIVAIFSEARSAPVDTRYCGDIGFLLDLHRDIDRLSFEIEVTSFYDIFFQHHNDAVAIT